MGVKGLGFLSLGLRVRSVRGLGFKVYVGFLSLGFRVRSVGV